MNPIKLLINEVKKDIQTVRDIKEGKAKLISWKELDFKGAVKTYWPWFLIVIAFFCAGIMIGSILAHNHYIEVIEEKCPEAFGLNQTQVQMTKSDLDYQSYILKDTKGGFSYENERQD